MNYQTLTVSADAPDVVLITLNRPEKRNAISAAMIDELITALDDSAGSSRVTIITGSGKAFCAGMDLEMLRAISAQSAAENMAASERMKTMFLRLYDFPRPLIAAVNGHAIAGGCGIASLCDFTLAVPEANFGYTEAKIGFLPALVSVFLLRQVGEKRARDLLLTGRLLSAEEALRFGLLTEIVPHPELLSRARALASALLANSPSSLERTKRLLRSFDREQILRELELAVQENAGIRATADFREGVASFLEKRKPTWHGE